MRDVSSDAFLGTSSDSVGMLQLKKFSGARRCYRTCHCAHTRMDVFVAHKKNLDDDLRFNFPSLMISAYTARRMSQRSDVLVYAR